MEDMAGYNFFLSRPTWFHYCRTWLMRQQERVVRSRRDYILRSDHQIFQNVAVRDPRHNSDHFMVVGSLCGTSPREHSHYLRSRTRLPLRPPRHQTSMRADDLFAELWCAVPKPDKRLARHNSWISEKTGILVDERVSMRRDPGRYQRRIRRFG